MVGGAVVTSDAALAERLQFLQKSVGAVPGPFDCFLVLRGLKTLAVRMERHCDNAGRSRPASRTVPRSSGSCTRASPTIPATRSRRARCGDFGGMVSFLARLREEAEALVTRTKVWKLAESLGGIESLIEVPAGMNARLDQRASSPRRGTSSASRSGRVGRRPRG